MIATAKAAGASGKYYVKQQDNLGKVNGFVEEMMRGQKVVKVFSHERVNQETFDGLNEELFGSADKATRYSNSLGPLNAQIGNISYVLCAMVGGLLALKGFGGFTLGGLASYLTLNRSFAMPINQMSQQLNSIVMALAGANRIFALLDEEPEEDNGYVTLVRSRKGPNGEIMESVERTGEWAWKHTHQADGSVPVCGARSEDRLCRIYGCGQDNHHQSDQPVL